MDYYSSTEWMYETDNLPDFLHTYIDADKNEVAKFVFIVFESNTIYTIYSAYEMDIYDEVYNIVSFDDLGLTDDDASNYLFCKSEIEQLKSQLYSLHMIFNKTHYTLNLNKCELEKLIKDCDEKDREAYNVELEELIEEIQYNKDQYEVDNEKIKKEIESYKKLRKTIKEKIQVIVNEKNILGLEHPKMIQYFLS